MYHNIFRLFLLNLLLSSTAISQPCSDQPIPQNFYFSSIINSLNLQLESYFNHSCPATSYFNISNPLTQINTGYINNQMRQHILSGLIYPQNVTYELINVNTQLMLRWYKNQSLSSTHLFNLTVPVEQCGFAMLFIDYGIFKNFPAYQIVGLCRFEMQRETYYARYSIKKYRAESYYDFAMALVPNITNIDPKSLHTTYSYDGSSYIATISAISHSYTNFQFLVYNSGSKTFVLENSKSISIKMEIQVDIVGVVFGLDRTGSVSAYLDRKGRLIFYKSASQKRIWTIPNAEIRGQMSVHRVWWSSVLGVYLGNSLVFVRFVDLGQIDEIGRISCEQGLDFVVIGKYLVGYRGNSTHFYHIREDGTIFYRFYNQKSDIDFDQLDHNGLQEDLFSTNSFYYNTNKYSISPYSIGLNSNANVEWQWSQCNKSTKFEFLEGNGLKMDENPLRHVQIGRGELIVNRNIFIGDEIQYGIRSDEIFHTVFFWKYASLPSLDLSKSCWTSVDDSSFVIFGQSSTNIDFYHCTWDQICTPFFKIQNQQFNGNCFLSTLHPQPNITIINGIFSSSKQSTILQISKQTSKDIQLLTRLKLNDKLLSPSLLYQVYQDNQNYEISYIAQTPIQNNAYCHYYIRVVNGTITAKFNYPFQFESFGYSHCVTQGVILLYRSDKNGLGIKKVGLRQNSYYVIEDAIFLPQYKQANVVCSKNHQQGLIIKTDQLLHYVDKIASKVADWKLNKAWDTQYMKQTDSYLLIYNTQQNHTQIYNKTSGFKLSAPLKTDDKLSVSFGDIFCSEEQHICFKYAEEARIKIESSKKVYEIQGRTRENKITERILLKVEELIA